MKNHWVLSSEDSKTMTVTLSRVALQPASCKLIRHASIICKIASNRLVDTSGFEH